MRSAKRTLSHSISLGKVVSYLILSVFAFIAIFPILWIFITALKDKNDIFSNSLSLLHANYHFDNFIYVLQRNDYIFLTWLKNSFLVALLTSVVCIFFASTAAYAFSRFKFPGRKVGLYLFMLVQMFPGVILIIPLYYLMRNLGLLNTYGGLILSYCASALPFCVWMLKRFFDGVPKSLEEAARIDGMGPWGIFWYIMVPLVLPGFAVTLFFAFITAWNEFMVAMTFMSNEQNYTLPVGIQTFVHEYNTEWHLMSAAGILITLPALLVFIKLQPLVVSDLTKGATKN